MSGFLIGTILAQSSSGGNDALWVQLLVIVILAAGIGVYCLVRKRPHKGDEQEYYTSYRGGAGRQWKWKIQPLHHKGPGEVKPAVSTPLPKRQQPQRPTLESPKQAVFGFASKQKGRDLHGGMELLEMSFLLSVLEDTSSAEVSDVTMRRLCFEEAFRREKLNRVSSKALKIYAKDEQGFYGREIQCEALKQLSRRTKTPQQAAEKVARGA